MNNSRRKMLRGTVFTTIGLIVLLLLLYKKILIYKNDKIDQNTLLSILNLFEITFGKMLMFVIFSLIFFGLVNIYTSKSKIKVDKGKLYAYILLFLSMSLYFTQKYISAKLPGNFFESGRKLLEIGFNVDRYPNSGGLTGSLLAFPIYKVVHSGSISIILLVIIVLSILFLLKDFIVFGGLLIIALIKYYRSDEYKKKSKILKAKKIIEKKEQQNLRVDKREELKNKIINARKEKLSFELSRKPKLEAEDGEEHYSNSELERKQREWLEYLEEIRRDKERKKKAEAFGLTRKISAPRQEKEETKPGSEEASPIKTVHNFQEEFQISDKPEVFPKEPDYTKEAVENNVISEEYQNIQDQLMENELLEEELNENILMNESDYTEPAPEEPAVREQQKQQSDISRYEKMRVHSLEKEMPSEQKTFSPDTLIQKEVRHEQEEFHKISIDDIFVQREPDENKRREMEALIQENVAHLESVLKEFGIDAQVVDYQRGPTITRYELIIPKGIRVNKVTALADDIAMNMSAESIRIEAPIPGKNTIGIETPNKVKEPVYFSNLIRNKELEEENTLKVILGKDIVGKDKIIDIAKMPHLLIAGQTGSGKSVAVNTLIASLITKKSSKDVKFIMVDPKMVELMPFNGIPHLLLPVIIDPKQASIALKWAVSEMENRYRTLMEVGVRNIQSYNQLGNIEKMPFIIIIIDELADLMMVAAGSVEESIARIAQKARAVGIHLVVATQRPSTDVITGMIKANLPSRISFALRSQIDSRTILDSPGAEKLLGKGDMLLLGSGSSKLERIQGAFISDEEVHKLTTKLKANYDTDYNEGILFEMENDIEKDELFNEAVDVIRQEGKASISLIQRKLKIGFNRASRIYDQLMDCGVINEDKQVLMDEE
jgi:S-DNA-T family DNA segregation ATPase FtsK/SpoIIIE